MKRITQFLRTHGELIFLVAVFAITAGVIGPNLDRYDALHHPVPTMAASR